jgi:hypothetical protein
MGKVSRSVTVSLAEHYRNDSFLVASLTETAEFYSRPQLTTLVQMFQPQGSGVRHKLVELLSEWNDSQASVLLAQRALFDLSPDVRATAVAALDNRPAREYRSVLLDGLRYPWPPVADHAAEALVRLRDRDATADLVGLLDKPDPRRPYQDDKKRTVVTELVALNHLRNCLVCHAPSFEDHDPARGAVPELGQALSSQYYTNADGSPIQFVRADITYLKQDFSVFQPVSDADRWPQEQRFDYLVRRREVAAGERFDVKNTADYPQRESVLFALRDLTGEDRGCSSSEWRSFLARKTGAIKHPVFADQPLTRPSARDQTR